MRTGIIFTLIMFLGFYGCGNDDSTGSSNDSSRSLDNLPYNILDSGDLLQNSNNLTGTGSVIFVDPTKNQENHFEIRFSLEDGGSLSVTANAENDLKNGIAIQFSRSGTTLNVKLIKDSQETGISESFAHINASEDLTFQIDVHNSESPAHFLVWSGVTSFSGENSIFNSEEGGTSPGRGTGNLWGLTLSKATVTSATVSAAKFEEH